MGKWSGEAALAGAFSSLSEEGGDPSAHSPGVQNVVDVCLSNSAEYKMVVFDIEKIMKGLGSLSNRMKAMYVIDGICTKSKGKSKEQMQSRFAGRMKQICALLDGCDGAVRTKFIQLIARWKRAEMMPSSALPEIDDDEPALLMASDDASVGVVIADSSSKAKDKKKDEKKSSKGKVIKYCSFREGSCPFGEKCRFSHAAQGANYAIDKRSTRKLVNDNLHVDGNRKYARIAIDDATEDILALDSKIPVAISFASDPNESSTKIEFTRNKIDAYTSRSDIQVCSISSEDLAKIFV